MVSSTRTARGLDGADKKQYGSWANQTQNGGENEGQHRKFKEDAVWKVQAQGTEGNPSRAPSLRGLIAGPSLAVQC